MGRNWKFAKSFSRIAGLQWHLCFRALFLFAPFGVRFRKGPMIGLNWKFANAFSRFAV